MKMTDNMEKMDVEMLFSTLKQFFDALDCMSEKTNEMEKKCEQMKTRMKILYDNMEQIDFVISSTDTDMFKMNQRVLLLERKLARLTRKK